VFWAWAAGLVIGAFLLLLVPVRLEVAYQRLAENDHLWLKINLPSDWGLWQLEITSVQSWWRQGPHLSLKTLFQKGWEERDRPGEVELRHPGGEIRTLGQAIRFIVAGQWCYWLGVIKAGLCIWQQFLARVTCRRWRFYLSLGTGEPASTALMYGSTWVILSRLYRNLLRRAQLDFKKPDLEVRPQFNTPGWQADFNCIFYLRLGHIISAGLRSLWQIIIIAWQTRGGRKSARTSYRNPNEDRNGKHQGYG